MDRVICLIRGVVEVPVIPHRITNKEQMSANTQWPFSGRETTCRHPKRGLCCFVAMLIAALAASSSSGQQILKWSGAESDPHPCLYITAQDIGRLKKTRKDLAELSKKTSWSLESDGMDKLLAGALLAENSEAQKVVIAEAIRNLDIVTKRVPDTTIRRVGPHAYGRQVGFAAGLADAALASTLITAQDRAAILEKIARLSYLMADPNYWTIEKGNVGLNPNMTTMAYGYRVTFAALIPSHPMSEQWLNAGLAEIKREIDEWTDPAGGMLECPHYSMLILDHWLGACLAARNAGVPETGHLFDEGMRKASLWFANISTPRGSNGFRRLPSLGHTYSNERTSTFGLLAYLWSDKDRAFASKMQWMHREHGSFHEPGIKSYYPALMGYRTFLLDETIPAKPPALGSAVYPETGVLLRNTIGASRETTLYLIAGRNHSHYYDDSGSITIWGKGSELCTEDAYGEERIHDKNVMKPIDSKNVHSMVVGPATYNPEEVMAIRHFSTSADFDYLSGTRRGWQRQIAMVKDRDPNGSTYFVMTDTLDAKSVPATWRLFVRASQIKMTPMGVTIVGVDDVDMDVVFVRPAGAKLRIHSDHVSLAVGGSGSVTAVLYPRLKKERQPQVSALADGRGVKLTTSVGTDYVFLDPSDFSYSQAGVAFKGHVGLIKVRGGKRINFQPGPCDVAPGWEGGNRELRMIPWNGPQYPSFPYK
jgi:hypothetical protein